MSSVSWIHNATFVFPDEYRHQPELRHDLTCLSQEFGIPEDSHIFVKYLHQPSIIFNQGLAMQPRSFQDLVKGSPILSRIFGVPTPQEAQKTAPEASVAVLEAVQEGSDLSPCHEDCSACTCSEPEQVLEQEQEALTRRVFFRYSRPKDPNNDWRPSPTGGICYRIDLQPEANTVEFSVAICRPDENFNREMARTVSTHRMNGGQTYVLKNYDHEFSLLRNIKMAAENYLNSLKSKTACGNIQAPYFDRVPGYLSKPGRSKHQEIQLIADRT